MRCDIVLVSLFLNLVIIKRFETLHKGTFAFFIVRKKANHGPAEFRKWKVTATTL